MRNLWIVLLGLGVFSAPASVWAADLEAGKLAFEKHACASCHGADAKTPLQPDYPVLAGQHADYLTHALRAYKRGQSGAPDTANIRKNAIMGPMAAQLSADDIRNISGWLSTLPSPLAVRK